MSRNETIDAVLLMRTLRAKLNAEMKDMSAQERLDYIRRAAGSRQTARPKSRQRRIRRQPARV